MDIIGVVDIGSNSIRMVLARVDKNGIFKVIDELKESVGLGKDIGINKELSTLRIQRAIQVLKFYKDICEALGAVMFAVATAAVRNAPNRNDFIIRVKEELGIDIRVLSGEEEAYYDYFSTVNSMDISNALIMDIGGSSTELVLVENRKAKDVISLPFGAITLSEMYSPSGTIDKKNEKKLMEFLMCSYKNIEWLNNAKNLPLVGIGGTIKNIGKINRKKRNYPLNTSHNYYMNSDNIIDIYNTVRNSSEKQIKKIKGLSQERWDIFSGALAAVTCLINYCSVKDIYVSRGGIREGLLYEKALGLVEPVEDVLEFSLNSLIESYGLNISHSKQVWKLAKTLYEELKEIHSIKENVDKILKTASMLHDLGISINYYDHHKHSLYTILNSSISGLTHRQLVMAAYAAAMHRKDEYKVDSSLYKDIIDNEDVVIIKKLGILIKISENLDRGMNGNIKDIQCNIQDNAVVIKVFSRNNPKMEISSAQNAVASFEKMFGRKLIIV